ncbi:conserved hypothetical protein [Candida dubliniensis CD36]|uniref:Uncharacterized protein n=1 Tax=Candida dubliniensis (strain CD36 / ATCC MYA-646 / CBS 7987 / NCPF 3949 / NRRL Y-17841) TaxID=573826 RepID=B9WGQ0_CANDC|nr:conserved hypothetical protein [Candida dubliniensis CD36]CAX42426.1 conserved hypothetical protein [Candida dubliniensis CD36]
MSDKPKSESKLPDIIKIDEITSGKIDPQLIYDEIERLKAEINTLRNDMSLFLKALATIPTNQSQMEYYKLVVSRLKTVQNSIVDYCDKYNKLLPIINLAQIKLGHDVEGPPPSKIKSEAPTNNNTPNMGNKTTPVMGNSTTPSTLTGNTNTAAYSTSSNTASKPTKKTTKKASVSNKGMGSSANQPIVI